MGGRGVIDIELERALWTLAAQPVLLVATDFDGTLAPIVTDPLEAEALAEAVDALDRLSAIPGTYVSIVTGRPLETLATLGRLPADAWLIGCHGAEWGHGSMEPLDRDQEAALALARRTVGAAARRRRRGAGGGEAGWFRRARAHGARPAARRRR